HRSQNGRAWHIVYVEPLHQLAAVGFDGFHAQIQAVGEVSRGVPFRDEVQDSRRRVLSFASRPAILDLDP
ncbi:MAG TPA: hypothetical protein VF078_09695, partial [Nitrospira sp.]